MKLRAAKAGYILRQWSVGCSPDYSVHGREYRWWLKDHLAIYGVRSAALASGVAAPENTAQEQLMAEQRMYLLAPVASAEPKNRAMR